MILNDGITLLIIVIIYLGLMSIHNRFLIGLLWVGISLSAVIAWLIVKGALWFIFTLIALGFGVF